MTPTPHPGRYFPLWQSALILFITGALGGSLGDYCHVVSGTDGYPPGGIRVPLIGLPYWVPLIFGVSGVAIGLSHAWLDSRIGPARNRPGLASGARVCAALAFMLATWAASGFLPLETGGSMDFLVGACAVAAWWVFDRTSEGIKLALLTAGLGTMSELVQVRFIENFYYIPPATNLGGVPTWLPLLYISASVALGNFGRWLEAGPNSTFSQAEPATR